MPDATCLHHVRWRKKKVDGYIIPANFFYNRVFDIAVNVEEVKVSLEEKYGPAPPLPSKKPIAIPIVQSDEPSPSQQGPTSDNVKVSALSLKSIRAKRELEQSQKAAAKDSAQLPTEPFTETDMLLHWTRYAQRLGDKGQKIMESYLLINDPKLEGTKIIHELPNEGSKIDFESEKHNLLGYLRGKLHNHDITIEVVVNESIENKKAFTNQDRFNRLNEINPGLDLLRRTFDLDF